MSPLPIWETLYPPLDTYRCKEQGVLHVGSMSEPAQSAGDTELQFKEISSLLKN